VTRNRAKDGVVDVIFAALQSLAVKFKEDYTLQIPEANFTPTTVDSEEHTGAC
jgi:hypothetical protein